jgi:serine/threonine protein kinase
MPFTRPARRSGPALTAADSEDAAYLEKRGYRVIEDLKPVTRVTSWGQVIRKNVGSMNVGLFIVTGGYVPAGKQGFAKLMVKHQYQDPEEEILLANRMGRAGLGPKVYDVVRFRVRDEKSGKMNEIYALIMERMDGSLVDLMPFQPHELNGLMGRIVRIYLDTMLKYRIRHSDPKPANYLFDLTSENKYRIVLGDYGIADRIKDEHFNAKDMKRFIDHDMFRIFMVAYRASDDDQDRRPASSNYELVYQTLEKAVGQAHVVIDRLFNAEQK